MCSTPCCGNLSGAEPRNQIISLIESAYDTSSGHNTARWFCAPVDSHVQLISKLELIGSLYSPTTGPSHGTALRPPPQNRLSDSQFLALSPRASAPRHRSVYSAVGLSATAL